MVEGWLASGDPLEAAGAIFLGVDFGETGICDAGRSFFDTEPFGRVFSDADRA